MSRKGWQEPTANPASGSKSYMQHLWLRDFSNYNRIILKLNSRQKKKKKRGGLLHLTKYATEFSYIMSAKQTDEEHCKTKYVTSLSPDSSITVQQYNLFTFLSLNWTREHNIVY